MSRKFHIESLLSARIFVEPQISGEYLYFISDSSGRLSLYRMRIGGSVPEPLIPPNIALPNPHHLDGTEVFCVLPKLGKILLMLDQEGDENYQPMLLPIDGGIPELLFGDRFAGQQVICQHCDAERLLASFTVDPRRTPVHQTLRADLQTGELTSLGESPYGNYVIASNDEITQAVLGDGYTVGDNVLFSWSVQQPERQLLYGTPLEARTQGQTYPLSGFGPGDLTQKNGLLLLTALFDDHYSLGYIHLSTPQTIHPVKISGIRHLGDGEMTGVKRVAENRYTLSYNIDGCSWLYEGSFNDEALEFQIRRVICGEGKLSNGVLASFHYDKASERYALAFSTATSPVQLYVVDSTQVERQTDERVLGIAPKLLSAGEDASYTSHDGLRISARLYLPAADLGYTGKRPVIFYIHGGPQSQERPDFTWFSMPLIQFLALNGFAVFVPNVRGSTGYGLAYTKHVDHDWGGQDRMDHVVAFEKLRNDPRLDMDNAGVMGRSYGGYMTLTQVGRHPDLWKAAVDMFGPYNLFTFLERIPETWKVYFYMAIGHPEKDQQFLRERSPSTYLDNLACPMLVIQGANDPRVVEQESRDVVEQLQAKGKDIEYMVFGDEGHDVIKYQNKVICYNRITDFFAEHLMGK
ncbi:MAG: prolyl oligopeptidase family serine peptidase [Caldilineaceae bacterium]